MKFKNYIILFIIYILTILLVFYLFFLYRNSNDKLDNTFNKIINQVNNDSFDDVIKNIDNYMIEYKEFILYINFDDALNNYELRLNEFIHDNNVSDMFISLRIFDNKLSIVNKILEHYKYNGDFKIEVPLYIYFKDGVIIDILYDNNDFEKFMKWFYELGVI